jgi:RND family efflux transporter MFP subunit
MLEKLIQMISLHRVLIIVSMIGVSGGLYMTLLDRKPVPVAQPITLPSVSPYKDFIAGSGIIEAKTENITLGTIVSGVVSKVFVKSGDTVKKGAPLFALDDRQVKADLQTKLAQIEAAKSALEQSKATLKDAKDKLNLINRLSDKRAITAEELLTRKNNVMIAEAAFENAAALLKSAKAQADAAQTTLELYTILAPLDCQVLQVNVRPGQFAAASESSSSPLMLIGSIERHHVRVDVDENDAWRFSHTAQATGFLRGNIQYKTPLKFEYLEPYVIPKKSLTGDSTERVDTRVLQVVYSYDPTVLASYIGQQMDVYIEAPKVSSEVKYGGPLEVSK